MPRAALVDYGASNTLSIRWALERVGFEVSSTSDRQQLLSCDAIVIPGVGHFGQASRRLMSLRQTLVDAIESGTPLLGICLGLQILFEDSEESAEPGLALLNGNVVRLTGVPKTPHNGWNELAIKRETALLRGVEEGTRVYFVHSYHVIPEDPEVITAVTDYGQQLVAAVQCENVFGTQFHPEKSGRVGSQILQNFYQMAGEE